MRVHDSRAQASLGTPGGLLHLLPAAERILPYVALAAAGHYYFIFGIWVVRHARDRLVFEMLMHSSRCFYVLIELMHFLRAQAPLVGSFPIWGKWCVYVCVRVISCLIFRSCANDKLQIASLSVSS